MATHEVRADMLGTIIAIDCEAGAHIEEGAQLLVVESMKMECPLVAPVGGSIAQINVAVGDVIDENQVLIVIRS